MICRPTASESGPGELSRIATHYGVDGPGIECGILHMICRPTASESGPRELSRIATHFGVDGPGIESQWGTRFSAPVQTGPGVTQLPMQWVPGVVFVNMSAGAWR
jgi:hypothetical protein